MRHQWQPLLSCLCSVSACSHGRSSRFATELLVAHHCLVNQWSQCGWRMDAVGGPQECCGPQMASTKGPAAITPAAAAWCSNKSGETINDEASGQHLLVKRIVGRRKPADLLMQHHQTQEKMQSLQASCYLGGRNKPFIKGKNWLFSWIMMDLHKN